jgi:hypothetical protein
LHQRHDLVIRELNPKVATHHLEQVIRINGTLAHLVHYSKRIYGIKLLAFADQLLPRQLHIHFDVDNSADHLEYPETLVNLGFLSCSNFFVFIWLKDDGRYWLLSFLSIRVAFESLDWC